MFSRMPARRQAWRERSHGFRLIPAVIGAAVGLVSLLVLASSAATRPLAVTREPVRLVPATTAAADPARWLSTAGVSHRYDPWRRYLADEHVCPGSERTDLPLAEQTRTVACLLNFARRKRGLQPLSVDAVLSSASARKASAIRRCERFAHNPCGGDWTAAVRSQGYSGLFGENLYLASGVSGAPRPTVDAWLNSAPHRENLFEAQWRQQGLAVVILPRFAGLRDVAIWVSVLGS